ncbi:hypothetical protein [Synechococcus sp. HK01-R]|uniref:hypothetical protein n=1 Tax=Synechococcus sp. HK01-R TaxID=2751171 RepID=UPI00162978F1|nr:hypothetical protein [Synechococcus sp. HK01-R]QNG26074.1 hypothetical protein H0O21_07080 [Synechococcus sp. HK01-R]
MQLPLFPQRPAAEVLAELERLRTIRPAGPRAPKPPGPGLALTEEQREKALRLLQQTSNPRTKQQRHAYLRQLLALLKAAPQTAPNDTTNQAQR